MGGGGPKRGGVGHKRAQRQGESRENESDEKGRGLATLHRRFIRPASGVERIPTSIPNDAGELFVYPDKEWQVLPRRQGPDVPGGPHRLPKEVWVRWHGVVHPSGHAGIVFSKQSGGHLVKSNNNVFCSLVVYFVFECTSTFKYTC